MKEGSTKDNPNRAPKFDVIVKPGPDGTFKIAVVGSGLRLKRVRKNLIEIADLDEILPFKFTYNDHKFYAKLVFKIHRKFPPLKAVKLNSYANPPPKDRFI
jgi:hypothetical protein